MSAIKLNIKFDQKKLNKNISKNKNLDLKLSMSSRYYKFGSI